MALLVPTSDQYRAIATQIIDLATRTQVEAIIYGSFVRGSAKSWLSDIDAMMIQRNHNYSFSPDIQAVFDIVTQRARTLRVPLQFSFVTLNALGNSWLFALDEWYKFEIRRWCDSPYKTLEIDWLIQLEWLKGKQYDIEMMRFFQRKIQRLGALLPELSRIIRKNEAEIDSDDQSTLREAWDILRKINHICSLYLRISGQKPTFWVEDLNIVSWYDSTELKQLFQSTKDIKDWFNYIKWGGIARLEKLITSDFEIICAFVDKNLWSNQ